MEVFCNPQWAQQVEWDFCEPVPCNWEDAPMALGPSDARGSLKVSPSHSSLHKQGHQARALGEGGLWMQPEEFAERLVFPRELQIHWKQHFLSTQQFWPMLHTRGVPRQRGRSLGCWAGVVGRTQPCRTGCPWAGSLGCLQQSWKGGKCEMASFVRSFGRSALGSRGVSPWASAHPPPASPTKE